MRRAVLITGESVRTKKPTTTSVRLHRVSLSYDRRKKPRLAYQGLDRLPSTEAVSNVIDVLS